jgi:DNA (cytosine-5)-methyltransferase 1
MPKRSTAPLTKNFAEFFAGIGLVREGLARGGWRCTYANDNDPRKKAMYEDRFGADGCFHLGDIRRTVAVVQGLKESPFLVTASFPCNDLSLAGRYQGLKGRKSSTFFAFASILKMLANERPKVVMLENVLGLLTSKKGKDFQVVAKTLAAMGYWVDAFVLDASHFVPQSRPRLFVVGVHSSLKPSKVAAERPKELTNGRLESLIAQTPLPTGWVRFPLPRPPRCRQTLERVLDTGDDQKWWADTKVNEAYMTMSDRHRQALRRRLVEGRHWVGIIRNRTRKGIVRAELRSDGLAGCLLTPKGAGARQAVVLVSQGNLRMRWLTADEYRRLQGAKGEQDMTRRKRGAGV